MLFFSYGNMTSGDGSRQDDAPPMWPQLPLIGIAWGTWFQDFDLASELPQILMQFTIHPLWRLGLRPRPPDPKRSQHFPLACKTNNHINHADGYSVTVKQFMHNILCMALIKYEKTNIHKSAVNFSEGKMYLSARENANIVMSLSLTSRHQRFIFIISHI